jgi:acyl-CoA synthetase (AMP-forming)/AMP-acid ligase II
MGRTLYTVMVDHAREQADSPALIAAERTVSFAELQGMVDHLADGLRASGLSSGDLVALLAMNRIEAFVVFGACAREGLILFPLNWRLSEGEIEEQLRLAGAKALIVDSANQGKINPEVSKSISLRFVLDAPGDADWMPIDELVGPSSDMSYSPEDAAPFLILATAAVEGTSRAALLSHANVMTAADQLIQRLALEAGDRHLAALPLFHITGLELSLGTLLAGGVNVLVDRFDPIAAVKLIEELQVTLLASFPPVLNMVLDAAQATGAGLQSLRYVLGLDAPDVIQRLLAGTQAAFWTGYGQSETTGVVTLIDVRERPGSVGRALPAADVQCFDESGEPVEAGTQGEIVVRGPLVFLGYWHDEDATQYAGRYGWHHTGDFGRKDEEGYLYYLGRKPEKDLIKSGGENVYPAEVEHVIAELPQVAGVCVIGVPDQTWGEGVKAIIELMPGADLSQESVISAVAERIASYKKPRQVEFVDQIPRTPEGEIDRAAVKSKYG